MKRRTLIVIGLVLSSVLCVAATAYLVALGARIDTQTIPLSPGQTYLGGGGLILGVLGLAWCLGLALRRGDPAVGVPADGEMPAE
ncbi:hypothetical protein [Cryobacterium sp. AP23]